VTGTGIVGDVASEMETGTDGMGIDGTGIDGIGIEIDAKRIGFPR
jgi:hypothetical protein